MSSEANKTISHTGIYAIGNVLRYMVSFIMLPIYTRCLTPADYGIIELLSMIIDLSGILLGLRMGEAIFRFYTQYDSQDEKNEVISTSLILLGILNLAGVSILMLGSGLVSSLVFGSGEYAYFVSLFAFTLLFNSFIEIPLLFVRAQQKPWLYVTFSLLKLMVQLTLNIYFVVILRMGVEGVIYSTLLSGAVIAAVMLGYTFVHIKIRFAREKAGKLVTFSLPLVIASLISFYFTFGDRFVLRMFAGLEGVGIYALGYKFGFLLRYFVWEPFGNIWDTQKYEIYRQENARQIYKQYFFAISVVMIFFALVVSVFIKDLLRVMSAPEFVSAYKVVPFVMAAYLVQSLASYCNLGIMLKGKTFYITQATIISAVVITLGWIILIPIFGVIGAALATFIGFVARFIWMYTKSKKLYDMNLSWSKVHMTVSLALGVYFLSLLSPSGLIYAIGFHSLLVSAFILLFVTLPIMSRQEKEWIANMLYRMPIIRHVPILKGLIAKVMYF